MKSLFTFLCFSLFFISGASILSSIGWPTDKEGHMYPSPTFFLIIILFVLSLINSNKIGKYKYEYIGVCLILLILLFNKYTGRVVPLKVAITSLVTPFFLSIIVKELRFRINRNLCRNIFVFFLIINSIIAIIEKTNKTYILGLTEALGGNDFGFRSHGLLGHPLSNSGITTTLMVLILISTIKLKYKITIWLIGFISLFCFNSRFSIVLSLSILLLWSIREFFYKSYHIKGRIIYLLIPILTVSIIPLLFLIGYGDRIQNMGLYDDKSTASRIIIWDLFNHINWSDLYVGINQKRREMLLFTNGTENIIIENCWIIFIFQYGYIFTAGMIIYFSFLFKYFFKGYSNWQVFLVLLSWLMTISSSNSIAVGGGITTILLFLIVFKPQTNKHDSKNNSLLLAIR